MIEARISKVVEPCSALIDAYAKQVLGFRVLSPLRYSNVSLVRMGMFLFCYLLGFLTP
jgi:hypothetical protein